MSLSQRILATAASILLASPAWAEICEETPDRHVERISGEIAGSHVFSRPAARGRFFQLTPARYGWELSVVDDSGSDLTEGTPPQRGAPNPRQLYGWHFRNASNTGPNTGDVNAPQAERRFLIAASQGEPAGAGWLIINDMGLADLGAGQRARLVYMRFEACLAYPKTEEERRREADLRSPDFAAEEIEMVRACGLGDAFKPEAWVLPRWQGADFDNDDALDFAVPVRRLSDGRRAIAICRAGTWLEVIGPGGIDLDLGDSGKIADYIQKVEAWRAGPIDDLPAYDGADARPDVPGDVLTLERLEKSAYSLYRADGAWRAYRHYRFVETEPGEN